MIDTPLSFTHLSRMTDAIGLFEHADHTTARREHGYCVDDVARGLVVTVDEPYPDERLLAMSRTYLDFLVAAQSPDGRFRNRRGVDGSWQDQPTVEDCWGRALWGLGSAAARSATLSSEALVAFDRSVHQRSPWSRAMAFAALGAAEVLSVAPDHRPARRLLRAAAELIGRPGPSSEWRWPEPRLRYANAVLPQVLLAAGSLLDEPDWTADGLAMLDWLVTTETRGGHLSVTPVGGWAPGEQRPGFDQQPIEVAALADATAVAYALTRDRSWSDTLLRCAAWFRGANDVGVPLFDGEDGSGCDGLERRGRNENRGAESTLAMLSTFQRASRLLVTVG